MKRVHLVWTGNVYNPVLNTVCDNLDYAHELGRMFDGWVTTHDVIRPDFRLDVQNIRAQHVTAHRKEDDS